MADVKIQSQSESSDSQPLVVDNQPPPPPPPPQQPVEEEENQPKTSPTPPPPLPFSPSHQYPNHHHLHHQSRENKTIWVGDLHHWMDDAYLNSAFASGDEIQIVSLKVIRNKHNGLSEGYGFVEFDSHDVADKVLQEFNGTTMPNSEQPFRLNWASKKQVTLFRLVI